MSNRAITWAYAQRLAASAKFVLVTLADFADEDGTCFPSQGKLAELTGLSVRSVRRAVEELEAAGLVVTEHRNGVGGYRTSDRYRLVMVPVEAEILADNLAGGDDRLPDILSTPTGHSDRAEENPHKNPQEPPTPLRASKPKRVASSFPNPFSLTREMREWAEANAPGVLVDRETESFVDYWRNGNGRGKQHKDWPTTWRTWMRRAQTDAERRGWKAPADVVAPRNLTEERLARERAAAERSTA